MQSTHFQGACLYMPANHTALREIASGERLPGLRAAVACFEDALDERDIDEALRLLAALPRARPTGLALYVRPRSVAMLQQLLASTNETAIAGFVLPKFGTATLERWFAALGGTATRIMPILETADVFDPLRVRDIVDSLSDAAWAPRIDAVRLGAVDLYSLLGGRRPPRKTIYDTVLGPTLRSVATQLMARGLAVTGPACETIHGDAVVRAEIALDVEAGFVGKTAVHPAQVPLINNAFRVTAGEVDEAQRLLHGPAVFVVDGRMCERAPHRRWAECILNRARTFGVVGREATGSMTLLSPRPAMP